MASAPPMEEKIDLSGNIEAPPKYEELKPGGFMSKLGGLPVTPGAAKEWVMSRRQHIRPWSEFFNTSKFQKPKSVAAVGSRAIKNVEHFMSNYLFVFIGLIIFCVLTSPMLLIVLGVCGGAIYHVGAKNQPRRFMGKELTLSQQYATIGVMSFPLLWLSGAGGAVFWILGATIVIIGLHAVFYKTSGETDAFDLNMEEVTVS